MRVCSHTVVGPLLWNTLLKSPTTCGASMLGDAQLVDHETSIARTVYNMVASGLEELGLGSRADWDGPLQDAALSFGEFATYSARGAPAVGNRMMLVTFLHSLPNPVESARAFVNKVSYVVSELAQIALRVPDTDCMGNSASGHLADLSLVFGYWKAIDIALPFDAEAIDSLRVLWATALPAHDSYSERCFNSILISYILLYPMVTDRTAVDEYCSTLSRYNDRVENLLGISVDEGRQQLVDWYLAGVVLTNRCPSFLHKRGLMVAAIVNSGVPLAGDLRIQLGHPDLLAHALTLLGPALYGAVRSGNLEILDENGNDAKSYWFHQVAVELVNPERGYFQETSPGSTTYKPSWLGSTEPSNEQLKVYEFAGVLIAACIIYYQRIPVRFTSSFYEEILGETEYETVILEDYESEYPEHYQHLRRMLESDIVEEGKTFTAVLPTPHGIVLSVDLVPDGSTIPVTVANKGEYIQKLVDFKIKHAIAAEINSMMRGFDGVLGPELFQDFRCSASELDSWVSQLPLGGKRARMRG